MTPTKPTEAEHERAAAYAEHCAPCSLRHGPPIDDEGILALARCYLALKAQLAESERAREALRAAAVRVLHGDKNSTARRDDGFPHCRTRRLGNLAMVVRSKRFAEEAYIELDDRDGILANALAADDKARRRR